MTQIHADNEFGVLLFPICVHLRYPRAIPDSVAAGRAGSFVPFGGYSLGPACGLGYGLLSNFSERTNCRLILPPMISPSRPGPTEVP